MKITIETADVTATIDVPSAITLGELEEMFRNCAQAVGFVFDDDDDTE